jgi:hypothetical protein
MAYDPGPATCGPLSWIDQQLDIQPRRDLRSQSGSKLTGMEVKMQALLDRGKGLQPKPVVLAAV